MYCWMCKYDSVIFRIKRIHFSVQKERKIDSKRIIWEATTFTRLSGHKRISQWKMYYCFELIKSLNKFCISAKELNGYFALHGTKQMVTWRSSTWWIHSVDWLWPMWWILSCLKKKFVVFFGVLLTFFLKCFIQID